MRVFPTNGEHTSMGTSMYATISFLFFPPCDFGEFVHFPTETDSSPILKHVRKEPEVVDRNEIPAHHRLGLQMHAKFFGVFASAFVVILGLVWLLQQRRWRPRPYVSRSFCCCCRFFFPTV
jgi:hypothetical protein